MIPFKVLIFGHDEGILKIVIDSLQSEKFITETSRWENIAEQIKRFEPDLMVLDFQSLDSCRQIKDNFTIAKVPFILISSTDELESYAKICEAAAYVSKPLDVPDFINTVKDILSI